MEPWLVGIAGALIALGILIWGVILGYNLGINDAYKDIRNVLDIYARRFEIRDKEMYILARQTNILQAENSALKKRIETLEDEKCNLTGYTDI